MNHGKRILCQKETKAGARIRPQRTVIRRGDRSRKRSVTPAAFGSKAFQVSGIHHRVCCSQTRLAGQSTLKRREQSERLIKLSDAMI